MARDARNFYRKNHSLSKKFQSKAGRPKVKPKKPKRYSSNQSYSKKDLIEMIRVYSAHAKTEKQQKDMDAFIDHYIEEERKTAYKRKHRDNKIERSMSAPVYAYPIIRSFNQIDAMQDAQKQEQIMKKAKQYYHHNYSLSKAHKKALGKTRHKDKDMTKG